MKIIALALPLFLLANTALSQQYMSRNASIKFFSETPIESIDGDNNQVSALLDAANGGLAFQVPIRAFHFEKALMEEHFNENYLETEKYPKATFQGEIKDWEDGFSDGNTHEVEVEGILNIHGVDSEISENGTISFINNNWILSSEFTIKTEDYNIKIPKVVRDQIAKSISIFINAELEPR